MSLHKAYLLYSTKIIHPEKLSYKSISLLGTTFPIMTQSLLKLYCSVNVHFSELKVEGLCA